MTESDPADPGALRAYLRAGWILFLIGWAGVFRLLPEALIAPQDQLPSFRWFITYDLVIASIMVVSGRSLIEGRISGRMFAMAASGAVLLPAVAWSALFVWLFTGNSKPVLRWWDLASFDLLPRTLFHFLALVLVPYVICTLLRRSPLRPDEADPQPSFRQLWICLIAALLFPAILFLAAAQFARD